MRLRIIGGDLRGKRLTPVRGTLTRPTSDRLRESIFNILSSRIQDAVVLDLFAGTGALGIEALSRGAALAVLIDSQREALAMLTKNVQACKLQRRAQIIKWDIAKNLKCLQSIQPKFNLVFMDPPYAENMIRKTLENLQHSGALEIHADVIVEHTPMEPIPTDLMHFELQDQRRYGKTLVSFLDYMV